MLIHKFINGQNFKIAGFLSWDLSSATFASLQPRANRMYPDRSPATEEFEHLGANMHHWSGCESIPSRLATTRIKDPP
jgi:hypothetical protein